MPEKILRLLLIEDNPREAQLMEESLMEVRVETVRVVRADRLATALPLLAAGGFDVVLLDLKLPDSAGLETLNAVKGAALGIPIVVLSGTYDEGLAVTAVARGAQDYIVKGRLDGAGIYRVLRYAVERRLAQDAIWANQENVREVERLRELNQFKAQFINMAAHELRTPLSPLRAQLFVLRKQRSSQYSEEEKRSLDILDRNVDRLTVLVDDLLQASRHQIGKMGFEPQPGDIHVVVREAVESFKPAAGERDISVELVAGGDGQGTFDVKRISQVVYNLLSNAVKFTKPKGNITVRSTGFFGGLRVQVTDNGIGIKKEDMTKLFQPFTQVHDTLQFTHPGSGLGLYICKAIIELHRGKIVADSPGLTKGISMTFEIPRDAAAPPAVPALVGATA